MALSDCIEKLGEIKPEMRDKILSYKEKYLKSGMDERQASIKAIESFGKDLHDRLNKIKRTVGIKEDKYAPYDSSEKKNQIEKKYAELEKQQTEQPITSSIKSEQNAEESNKNANGKESSDEQSEQRSEKQNGISRESGSQEKNGIKSEKEEGVTAKTEVPSSIEIFDAIEKADRSKISQREKNNAIENAVASFGDIGKKALEINNKFNDIVSELKRQNKLEVKC